MRALLAAVNDKKSSHDNNEGESAFQTIAIELDKQTKTQTKNNT